VSSEAISFVSQQDYSCIGLVAFFPHKCFILMCHRQVIVAVRLTPVTRKPVQRAALSEASNNPRIVYRQLCTLQGHNI
jgi:hypothetical protein